MADEKDEKVETEETETENEEESSETESSEESEGEEKPKKAKAAKEEDVDDEDEVSSQDKNLLALLKNPRTAPILIKALAEQHGFVLGETSTKKIEKTIKDEMKEALGDEWAFLAEKIGPVIEKRVRQAEEKVEAELGSTETKQTRKAFDRAETKFFNDNPNAKLLRKKMSNLAVKYPPPEDVDPEEYFTDLYTLAAGRKTSITDAIEKKRQKRIRDNQDQDDLDTRSSPKAKSSAKRMSLEDSIANAAKSILKRDI